MRARAGKPPLFTMASPRLGSQYQVQPGLVVEYGDEYSSDDSDSESVCSTVSSHSVGDLSVTKVYVRYPTFINKEQLQEHFNIHGYESNVLNIHVNVDKVTHSAKGSAIVALTPASIEIEAIQRLNQTRLLGKHKVVVKPFKTRPKGVEKRKKGKRGSAAKVESVQCGGEGMKYDSDTESVSSTSGEFCRVHVSSSPPLADFVTNKHLQNHFSDFDFTSAFIVRDRKTKKSKGFAFITFSSKAEADNAIKKMNGCSLLAQFKLRLKYAKSKQGKVVSTSRETVPKQASSVPPLLHSQPLGLVHDEDGDSDTESVTSPAEFCKVHVSASPPLASFVTSKHLQQHFSDFEFTSAYVVRDPKTKKARGFGFVTFVSQAEADSAIAKMNGSQLAGKFKLHLKYAKPKKIPVSSPPFENTGSMSANVFVAPLPPAQAMNVSGIVIENLDHLVTENELKVMITAPIHAIRFEPTAPDIKTARVSLLNPTDVDMAIKCLNGKQLLGKVAKVSPDFSSLIPPILTPVLGSQTPPVSTSTPEQSSSVTYGVKVTHLSPKVTEEAQLLSHFQSANPKSCKIVESKNYAHVNFCSQKDAQYAVSCFHGSLLEGQKINVRLSYRPPPGSNTPAVVSGVATLPTEAASTCNSAVKVANLPFGIEESTLRGHFQRFGRIISIHIKPKQPPYAFINFSTLLEANTASANMHETMLAGSRIRVQVQTPPANAATTTGGPAPMNQQPSSPTKYEGEGQSSTGDEVQVMQLLPDQWNRLMTVGPLGTILYEELQTPFESNPNVKIQQDVKALSISFSGVSDAVWAAYKHFNDHFNKEVHIRDRLTMKTLLYFHANLPNDLLQRHGVELSGFQEGSSVIKLNGQSASVQVACKEIDMLVCGFITAKLAVNFNKYILTSARKRLAIEHVKAVIEMHDAVAPNYPELHVCSVSKTDHAKAVHIVTTLLLKENVHVAVSSSTEQQFHEKLVQIQEIHSVSIQTGGSGEIILYGFIPEDLQAAKQNVVKLIGKLSVEEATLAVTPDQLAYLQHIREHNEEAKSLLHSLPAKVYFKPDRIVLSGNSMAIQETQEKILKGPILSGVHIKVFAYHCHVKFLPQIEQCGLVPLRERQLDFSYATEEVGSSRFSKGRGKEKKHPESTDNEFKIIVFTKDPAAFKEVCEVLSAITPSSKYYPLHPRAQKVFREIKPSMEEKYKVRIIFHESLKKGFSIHGLSLNSLQDCSKEIEDHVDSKVEIAKYILINEHQYKYFRSKGKFEELKSDHEGVELQLYKPRGPQENFSITIKGTMKQVKSVHASIMELPVITQGLSVEKFEMPVHSRKLQMWKKRWMDIKNDQEQKFDLIVEFNYPRQERSASASSKPAALITVTFEVIGTDRDSVQQVKEMICKMEIQEKTLSFSSAAISTIYKGLSELQRAFRDQLAVDFFLDRKSNQVILTAPQEASEDLQSAEEVIQQFVGNRVSSHVEVTSGNPVVNLIFTSKSRSVRYLMEANTLAKPHDVSVRPLRKPRNGLLLSGNKDAIELVKPLIQTQILHRMEQDIKQVKLEVESIYGPIFTTADFSRFESKLQDELCVICTYPRLGKKSRAVRSTIIQPSETETAHGIKLEVCKGNLVLEQVDVIVNAANEELKHIGGLAKAILDAGGSCIQAESDRYVLQHGKLPTGGATCLGAGNLPCKKIIHAVGPRWKGGKQSEEQSLYFTVWNSLQEANRERMESIALPAIGCGVFDVPDTICARASIKAVCDFGQSNPECHLHTVKFVLFTDDNLKAFITEFDSKKFKKCASPTSIQPISSASSSAAYKWLWQDDQGSFTPYTNTLCTTLTTEYLQNPSGTVNFVMSGRNYSIDFHTMVQRNLSTGVQRQVNFTSQASAASDQTIPQWYYKDDNGQFSLYTPADSRSIEQMYQASSPSQIVINRNNYTFDFSRMCQINIATNYMRSIQRKASAANGAPAPVSPVQTEQDIPPAAQPDQQMKIVVTLQGPKDTVNLARTKLEEKLKSLIKTNTIPLPSRLTAALENKLRKIAAKHNVVYSFEEDAAVTKSGQGSKVFKIKGLAYSVQNTTSSVQEEIINYQFTIQQKDTEIEIPQEWVKQTQTTEVFPVVQGSAEWNRVEQKFKQTLPNNIIQITRIQNTWLWDKYVTHKKRLHMKNNERVNELELFHGTRGNDPKVIYEGEDGFDMRYSASGMWGQANYFAVNASYSHGYAHTSSGSRELFLVRVLTGDSHQCGSNSTLRMPPFKAAGSSSGAGVQFSQMRYDTVTGNTGGSQVYMTYDNDKAYPAYLIKYQ